MTDTATSPRRRVLDPVDRVSEVLFGVIMVLTFTCSLAAGSSGREEVREMLLAALACNLAWGLVDAVIFLMSNLTERGRSLLMLRNLKAAPDGAAARRIVADALPTVLTSLMEPGEVDELGRRLARLPEPPAHARLRRDDWLGAAAVFLLVFLSTLPLALPFLLVHDSHTALRVSNGIAIAMLFGCGVTLGRYAGRRHWLVGLAMVAVGLALVAVTIALGG